MKRGFASDNNAPTHPVIFEAMRAVNSGHARGYGDDDYTRSAIDVFRRHFGTGAEILFLYGGTGANVVGLSAMLNRFNAVICAETSHINVDECGAPESIIGCKLLPVLTRNGKLSVNQIAEKLHGIGDQHHVQPRVVSITQPTELGTVYTREEIKAIADFSHGHGLWLHMDGARIANAAMHLDKRLNDITGNAGVDMLSFGGTKNGMMYGEAVVCFVPALAGNLKYFRKGSTQTASKMRFIAAQFESLLSSDLWASNALQANSMAQLLAERLKEIPQVRITQKVESNAVFAVIPRKIIAPLQKEYFFYVWNEKLNEVRWMTSWDITPEDVENFVSCIKRFLEN